MLEEIVLHRLSKDRIKDVQYLIKKVFNKRYTLDYLDNKYNAKKYCDVEYLCYLAYHNKKPIAFMGTTPYIFTNNTQKGILIQAHDNFIVKEYQKKGLNQLLLKITYELLKEVNAFATYSFHSELTYKSFKKNRWLDGYSLNRVHLYNSLRVPYFKLWSKYTFFNFLKKYSINKILKHYPLETSIRNSLESTDHYYCEYTKEYIAFKNCFNCRIIRIKDCKVWIKFDYILTIGEFENLTDQNFKYVMDELLLIAKKVGTNEVLIPFNSKATYAHLLEKSGMKIYPSHMLGNFPLQNGVDFNQFQINYNEFDTFF